MTTIILVAIGIVLAAASAMFMIFYGGDAYTGGATRAKAVTLENAGHNVESAATGYRAASGVMPAKLDDLKVDDEEGPWIASDPAVRNAATGAGEITTIGNGTYYRIGSVVDEATCRRVNQDYGGKAAVLDAIGDTPRGCYRDGTSLHYFVRLSGADAGAGSGSEATPPTPVKAAKGEPATCVGLQVGTTNYDAEVIGAESGVISAYSIAEANTVCQYLAAINGPGACLWDTNQIQVSYAKGTTRTASAFSWNTAAMCENKATIIPPRPQRNTMANATCSGGFVRGSVSGGRGGLPTMRLGSQAEAMQQCAALATQYGEGVCSYTQGGDTEYVRGAMAIANSISGSTVMQCR